MPNITDYTAKTVRSMFKFRHPQFHYTFPFVTGHKYKLSWGNNLDWDQFSINIQNLRAGTDLPVYFVIPFNEVRVKIIVSAGGTKANNTLPADPSLWQPGQNVVYNDTFNGTMHNETGKAFHVVTQAAVAGYTFTGLRCDPCYVP